MNSKLKRNVLPLFHGHQSAWSAPNDHPRGGIHPVVSCLLAVMCVQSTKLEMSAPLRESQMSVQGFRINTGRERWCFKIKMLFRIFKHLLSPWRSVLMASPIVIQSYETPVWCSVLLWCICYYPVWGCGPHRGSWAGNIKARLQPGPHIALGCRKLSALSFVQWRWQWVRTSAQRVHQREISVRIPWGVWNKREHEKWTLTRSEGWLKASDMKTRVQFYLNCFNAALSLKSMSNKCLHLKA